MKNIFLLALFFLFAVSCTTVEPEKARKSTLIGERKLYCSTSNEDAKKYYLVAHAATDGKNIEKAKEYYLKAIDSDPKFCDAMDNLGRLYRSEGAVDKAIQLYKRSLELAPTNTVALINLALAYNINNQPDNSIATYLKLKDVDASDSESYYGLGVVYFGQKKFEDAIKYLLQADQIYSSTNSKYISQSGYLLGTSYFRLGDCGKTISFLKRSYEQYKSNAEVNYSLGVCYLTKPQYSIADARVHLGLAEKAGAKIPDGVKAALVSSTPTYVDFAKPN